MDLSAEFCVSSTQILLHILRSLTVEKMFSKFARKSELEDLRSTGARIKYVLDVATRGQLFFEGREWIEIVRGTVYDVEDLLDRLCTCYERWQLKAVNKLSEKVLLFPRSSQRRVAKEISQGIKKIKMNLEAVANRQPFVNVDLRFQPYSRRLETSSFVGLSSIVGRNDDQREIVNKLLYCNRPTSVVAIVGMGGLGKTALAQLLYNDTLVCCFFSLKVWVHVSNQGSSNLDGEGIFYRILESITNEKYNGTNSEWLQLKCKTILSKGRFLLVLDDLWTEDRFEWQRLEEFLQCGRERNVIVITTRSKKTARIIGCDYMHELLPLSFDDSWDLFISFAAGKVNDEFTRRSFDKIGKDIVKSCEGVPLALKLIGSMLYGQDIGHWLLFHEERDDITKCHTEILECLKPSYDMLASHLKSCFVYCALFPKNYVLQKKKLIHLWMAQGYIVPQGNLSELQVGEQYFLTLYERSFFKVVEKNRYGEIISCCLHNLMHDLAQAIGKKEFCVLNSDTGTFKNILHVFHDRQLYTQCCFTESKIRTYVQTGERRDEFSIDALLAKWKHLRVLDLSTYKIRCLPAGLGDLLHLRYLDLSDNLVVQELPKSITKLHNLQILNLSCCPMLMKLPENLSKLVNLRVLDVADCTSLTYMPSGIDKLTCLQSLTMFVVAVANSISQKSVGHLEDIKALDTLEGCLTIKIPRNYADVEVKEGGYLSNKRYLNVVELMWLSNENASFDERDEALLKSLQPHPNVKILESSGYYGGAIWSSPGEGNTGFFPKGLVEIYLHHCHDLKCLPSLRELYLLRNLKLEHLMNLECIEIATPNNVSNSGESEMQPFVSLEILELLDLPKCQGWWRSVDVGDGQLVDNQWPHFPCLSEVIILNCPRLSGRPNTVVSIM